MSNQERPQILLTNDDGIRSPGLWAAAAALSRLGFVTVAAPRDQCSGSGRSMPPGSDGTIREERVEVGGQSWDVYAVGGSPAQAVQHGILELMPRRPDLVVAGINYGENVGTGVTVSGTVGAALEGAAFGIPALAVSLEVPTELHLSHSDAVDFSGAAHFTELFARLLLTGRRVRDVDVLKVEVPSEANRATPWRLTRLSRAKYYIPVRPQRSRLDQPGTVGYEVVSEHRELEPDSDAYALRVLREVAVTPLSLDLTSRVDLEALDREVRARAG